MTARRLIHLGAVALLLLAATARGADDGGGRSVFARGAGERALGLGGAYGATADDASALFWNPAGLARAQRVGLQASHTDLIGLGFYEQYGALVLPSWRAGTFALGLRRFGVDGIEGRDSHGALTDPDLKDAETELSVGYGRGLGDAWSLGAVIKLQNMDLAGSRGSGTGLDLGVQGRPLAAAGGTSAFARGLTLGVTLRNVIEPAIRLVDDDVPDPVSVRFAAASAVPLGGAADLLLAVDLERTRGMDARVHAGAELVLMDLLALRAGSNDGMLTGGAGLRWHDLSVDYAFEDNLLASVHRFGLGIAFGPTTTARQQAALDKHQKELNAHLADAFQREGQQRNRTLADEARNALEAGDPDAALERAQALLVLAPDNDEAPALAARALLAQGRRAEEAGDATAAAIAYERSLNMDADQTAARQALDRLKAESDRLAERSAAIRALHDEGMAHYVAGRYDEAKGVFAHVLEIDPEDREAAALLRLADQALRAERVVADATVKAAAAVAAVRDSAAAATMSDSAARPAPKPVPQASAKRPTFASLPAPRRAELADLYRRGVAAAEAGRRDDAVRYWELVWTAAPDYQQAGEFLKQEYLARGMEDFAGGRLESAVATWEKALAVDPDDPRTRGYLARAHEHLARLREIRRRN